MLLNTNFLKFHRFSLLLVFSCILFYISFAYGLVRTDYIKLIMLYAALFYLFYKLTISNKNAITFLFIISFLLRFIFLFALPNLSQDFYRFIWDGRMILEGINPYLFTPESFISKGVFPVYQAQELYNGMGILNGSHFTNYPPVNQLCFVIAGLFAGKSILGSAIVMRIIIILADLGTFYFGKKILEKLNIPIHNIFWYILNPFVIIELTGNLHFEGVMIFFLVWSLYLLQSRKLKFSAIILALSISVKLIPLIFLPLLFKWFVKPSYHFKSLQKTSKFIRTDENNKAIMSNNYKIQGIAKLIYFYSIVGLTTLVLFLPFYSSEFIINYTKTVALWFQDFEFNASLYYIARAIGYLVTGYNEISIIGKIIPILVVLVVIAIALFRKNKTLPGLITSMLLVLSFYYFTSTTVHPWYIATLLILSVFTRYRFPLIWSFVGILSYLAYTNSDNTENLWIIALEYTIIYSFFIWEVFIKKATKNGSLKIH
ncbi:mannosyltransferase [Yeosuana marina]|uniref:mannosyltransferase n=1 Tax=Yeosuana marina TaxID=1565536 RepID=UPI003C6F24B2|tara:strand:+ start:662 stop:2119 length:1458 start_codon:yes stop_codon:yes gene_type:complete